MNYIVKYAKNCTIIKLIYPECYQTVAIQYVNSVYKV